MIRGLTFIFSQPKILVVKIKEKTAHICKLLFFLITEKNKIPVLLYIDFYIRTHAPE